MKLDFTQFEKQAQKLKLTDGIHRLL